MLDLVKIYQALETIKETCDAHLKCDNCPLRDWEGACGVTDTTKDPCGWDIYQIKDEDDSFFCGEED